MSSPFPTRISFAASGELFVLDVWRDAEGSPVLPPHTSLRCAPPCPAPACVVSSAAHVAACDGTRVWYALCGSSDGPRWVSREYGAAVQSVSLGAAHAAVVAGSTLHVHGLLPCVAGDEDWQVVALPASAMDGVSSACFVAGATSLLYFGTQGGMVGVLELRDRGCRALGMACMTPATPNAAVAIAGVFPSPSGTCAVAVDVAGRTWAACPLDGSSSDAMSVPVDPRPEDTSLDESLALADASSAGSTHALWDVDDDGVVAISCDDRVVTCLCRRPPGVGGILLQPLGHLQLLENGNVAVDPAYTQLPHSSHAPLLLMGGAILTLPISPASCAQALPPLLQATVLASHAALGASMLAAEGKADAPYGVAASAHCRSLREAFLQLLALGRLTQAHRLAVALGDEPSCWLALGGAAMASLQLDIARAAYAALRDEGMVQALDALVGCEDVDALTGGVHALYGESDAAQSCMVACGDPSRALELRRAARQWPEALDIARRLVPDRMTQLLLEAAADAEAAGGFEAALAWYDAAALTLMVPVSDDPLVVGPERTAAAGGTARCSFQLGDTPRGMAALTEACSSTKDGEGEPCALLLACSAILEARGQAACAADLCMRAQAWDQAAALLLSVHDVLRAAALVERVSEGSPLLLPLAQAAEAAGDFVSAARGYERGAHTDALVRVLCCDALADLPRAAALAATTH